MTERPPIVSEDVRAEMTAKAAARARANRPRYVLYLGGLAVLVSLVFTVTQVVSRASAASTLDEEQVETGLVISKAGELAEAQEFESALGGRERLNPDPRMLSKISQAARDAGLVITSESERDDGRRGPPGMARRAYVFGLRNQPAGKVMPWLKRVTTDLPGVQMFKIDIMPSEGTPEGLPAWNVDVTFTRWERNA